MAGHGLAVPEEYVGHYDWHCDTAAEAARRLFEFEPRPSAVVAAGDEGAAGVLQAAREAGLRVPDDLAVVGFADILLCHTWSPPLTSVRQPKKVLGEVAARLVARIVAGEAPEDDTAGHLLPTELVVRESCGAGRSWEVLCAGSGQGAGGRAEGHEC
jgi:LacI family transcriptional regulator